MGSTPSLLARIDYCPLAGRPRLRWPHDARLAFWVIPNVEYYQYTPPAVRVGRSGFPAPDVRAYASRDYGNRGGFWRMLDVLDRHRIRCAVNKCTVVYQARPRPDWPVRVFGPMTGKENLVLGGRADDLLEDEAIRKAYRG